MNNLHKPLFPVKWASYMDVWKQKQLPLLILIVAACFPILKYAFSFALLSLLLVVSLFTYRHSLRSVFVDRKRLRFFFLATGFYWFLTASLLYTGNLAYGVNVLQHGLYLLVYPLIILVIFPPIQRQHVHMVLLSFLLATLLYSLYMHGQFLLLGLYQHYRPAEFNDLPFRLALMNFGVGSAHPTYVSMWFFFCALYLTDCLFSYRLGRGWTVVVAVFLIIYFIASAVILSSKISIIAFVVGQIVLLYLHIHRVNVRRVIIITILMVFTVAVFKISFLRARFVDELISAPLTPPVGVATNSTNIRIGIYHCVLDLAGDHWLFGVGVGDVQDSLNKCYEQYQTEVYKEIDYNSHNNFFDILLSGGIVAFVALLVLFFINCRDSLINDNIMFVVMIVLMAICMMAENILSRNHGVVFYSLFCSLFMKENMSKKDGTLEEEKNLSPGSEAFQLRPRNTE
jgi:O-antigen ligase